MLLVRIVEPYVCQTGRVSSRQLADRIYLLSNCYAGHVDAGKRGHQAEVRSRISSGSDEYQQFSVVPDSWWAYLSGVKWAAQLGALGRASASPAR